MHATQPASDGSDEAELKARYAQALRKLALSGDDPNKINLFIKSLNLKTAVNELLGD